MFFFLTGYDCETIRFEIFSIIVDLELMMGEVLSENEDVDDLRQEWRA